MMAEIAACLKQIAPFALEMAACAMKQGCRTVKNISFEHKISQKCTKITRRLLVTGPFRYV